MLERGLGHVIASDAHGAEGRPPDLMCALAALEQRYEGPHELFDWGRPACRARDRLRPAATAAPADAAQARTPAKAAAL